MSGQKHTAECRKRLEDVMTTDASASARVKAARVRQAERIIRNSNDPGEANPSRSNCSCQHKRVRFADQERSEPIPERDTEMRTGSQEAPDTRKRPAETDTERLEATSAEADSIRRLTLRRKAKGELDDSGNLEVEDSVINSLAKWHRENGPDDEVDLLILQQRDNFVASGEEPVCEEPKTPFPFDECGWDYIDDKSGKLLNNTHLSIRRELKRSLSSEV